MVVDLQGVICWYGMPLIPSAQIFWLNVHVRVDLPVYGTLKQFIQNLQLEGIH